jgi:membrane-associated protease RseP (regulator of RpoE activity)
MLGVQMTPVPLSVQEQQGLAPSQGVFVQSVYGNTAAQTMGLQPGDVITSINGAPISGMSDLRNEVSLNQVGDPVEVTIVRGGQEQATIGQFQPWPANIPYDPIDPAMEDRFREWQERRLARTQNEVDQLREQTAAMAKELADAAGNDDRGLFGIKEKPPMGADGQPLAWRFRYHLGEDVALADAAVATQAPPVINKDSSAAVSATATRTWRFDWQMASNRPTQEPL